MNNTNNNIINALDKIIKNKNKLSEFLLLKDIDEIYNFLNRETENNNISQEEFGDFLLIILDNLSKQENINILDDSEIDTISGGTNKFFSKTMATILGTLSMYTGNISNQNIQAISNTKTSNSMSISEVQDKIGNLGKEKIKKNTKSLTKLNKIMNNSDLKAAFYGLLTIGIPVAVICTILLIRTADSPKKAILNFKTGIIENAKNNKNYKDSIIALYVATHNKLLELSKIKNTSKIQSSDISCDDTEKDLKQVLAEKAQIFEEQKYYQNLINIINEIKFEEVEKKDAPKITETQEQNQQTSNIQKPIINLENQKIILTTETEKPENLKEYKNVDVNITNDTFKETPFDDKEKEWIKFLAGVLECEDNDRSLGILTTGGQMSRLPKQSRFKLCSKFCDWCTEKSGPMEQMHNYVQIVFPNIAAGQGDRDLYFDRLGKDKWSEFFTNNKNIFEKIRYNLNLRLIHMLKFWGFEVNINNKTQKIESLSVDASKSVVFDNGDHNRLRFTRVLHCLRLFGLNDEYKLLIDIVKKAKQNNKLTDTTYGYYTGTKNTECLI